MMRLLVRLRLPLTWAGILSVVYGGLSFAWSALGFLAPTAPAHLHEYPLRALAVEIGGHVLFGLVAALPTLDLGLVLLCGGEALLIDTDHVMGALNLPIQTRLSHSLGFMLVGPLVIGRIAGRGKSFNRAVVVVTFASFLSHLSYDVYAGNGSMPLFEPVSTAFYLLPRWTWIPLEAGAAVACAYVGLSARKRAAGENPGGPNSLMDKATASPSRTKPAQA